MVSAQITTRQVNGPMGNDEQDQEGISCDEESTVLDAGVSKDEAATTFGGEETDVAKCDSDEDRAAPLHLTDQTDPDDASVANGLHPNHK